MVSIPFDMIAIIQLAAHDKMNGKIRWIEINYGKCGLQLFGCYPHTQSNKYKHNHNLLWATVHESNLEIILYLYLKTFDHTTLPILDILSWINIFTEMSCFLIEHACNSFFIWNVMFPSHICSMTYHKTFEVCYEIGFYVTYSQ